MSLWLNMSLLHMANGHRGSDMSNSMASMPDMSRTRSAGAPGRSAAVPSRGIRRTSKATSPTARAQAKQEFFLKMEFWACYETIKLNHIFGRVLKTGRIFGEGLEMDAVLQRPCEQIIYGNIIRVVTKHQ